MRCYCRTKPSLQAEGWRHEDVLAHVGDRAGCPWSRVGGGSSPAEVFKLFKGTLRRCHYKAALCRIDLGSDVTARSGGDASADVEPLLLPPWGVSGGLPGVGGWAGVASGPAACFGLAQPGRSSLKAAGPWVNLDTARLVSAGLGKAWDSFGYSKKSPVTSRDNNGHCERMDPPPPPPGSHICFR